jgi:starch-binding outer membrane protein, SusD/RagB family
MTTSSLLGTPSRNTSGQVVAAIENDLTTARPLLGAAPSAASFDDKFINVITVDAIRARVALYKGDFAAAETLAGSVIATNVRPLATGANFNGIWTDAVTNAEVLLRLRRGGQSLGANYTTSSGQVYLSPSDKLNNILAANDIRKAAYIATVSGKRVVNKFYTSAAGARINDMKAIRIAEMYLIRAEARASKASPDLAGATQDINDLRAQRITGYVAVPTFASQSIAISEIMDERFKELCFEGFRFYDLKRRGMDMVRLASDVDNTNWLTLPASSHRFQFPIPASEILANPNMVQNANY